MKIQFYCGLNLRTVNSLISRISPGTLMKRAAPSSSEGGGKLKQMKLCSNESGVKKIGAVWKEHGEPEKGLYPLLYMMPKGLAGSTKVAAFDMDGCLIVPKSGAKFPKNAADWKFLSSRIPTKLKQLHSDGFKLVVFTNQAGIEKKKTTSSEIQGKIRNIMDTLGVPLQAFVSTGENIYRKPYASSWDFFVQECNDGIEVEMKESFFVGDAAGRPKDWQKGRKKDHSCSDRKFALNAGLKFYTPEEYFDGAKAFSRFEWGLVDPKTLLPAKTTDDYENIASNTTELVILVGYPASGKSTFARRYLEPKGYVIVNRDKMKTVQKCEKTADDSLAAGKSVAVDNTNPSKVARETYVKIAKKHGVPVRCFYFDVPIEVAKHMNLHRQYMTRGKIRRIPDVGYNVYKSKFDIPDKSEGYTEIKTIKFVPNFDSDEERKQFLKRN